jgi:CheY-like chemotaxis protein
MRKIMFWRCTAPTDFALANHNEVTNDFRSGRKRPCTAAGRVLVVEHRDEVFARLAADLGHLTGSITRATSSADASHQIGRGPVDLVLANVSPPDESAWLMVSKWRSRRSHVPIWLYSPWEAELDRHWREFTRIDGLIYYGGDVWRLSSQLERVVCSPTIARQVQRTLALKSRVLRRTG